MLMSILFSMIKGKKKKKPKTVMTLDQFLAETDGSSAPKAPNWATATEGIDGKIVKLTFSK